MDGDRELKSCSDMGIQELALLRPQIWGQEPVLLSILFYVSLSKLYCFRCFLDVHFMV